MPPQNSNFDFIMNTGQPQKRGLQLGTGGSFRKRIFMLIGFAIVGMIVIAVVGSFFKGGSSSSQTVIGLIQTQAEIVRVATEGSNTTTQISNQNLAIDIQLTLGSHQYALTSLLAKNGTKITAKQLIVKQNNTTDATLDTASQNGSYDVAFAQAMQTELTNYQSEIRTAYNATKNKTLRNYLNADFTQAGLLLKQVPPASSLSTP